MGRPFQIPSIVIYFFDVINIKNQILITHADIRLYLWCVTAWQRWKYLNDKYKDDKTII